jgi:predicted acyltransferase
MFLGILLWIIDIKGYAKWAKPFLVFGVNPLFLYVFSEVLAITFGFELVYRISGEKTSIANLIYTNCFLPVAGPSNASLLYALTFTFICWLTGWILFKNKIFIKL